MSDRLIENPLYARMSLKTLLETTDLFQIPGLLLGENGGGNKDALKKRDESDEYKPTAAFLGPDLWDNTQKMSVEYMDLDEFLSENKIPFELCMNPGESKQHHQQHHHQQQLQQHHHHQQQQQLQQQQEQIALTTPLSPSRTSGVLVGGNASPLRAAAVASVENLSPQICLGGESTMQFINPIAAKQRAMSPDPDSLLSESSGMSPIRAESNKFVMKVISKPSVSASSGPKVLTTQKLVDVEYNVNEVDLALATVPGIDFDPRERAFTDDELKPQPMIKKSQKQYIPEDLKDEHYWDRRNKNNFAAKRSREARRLKENQIAMRANYLEKENATLTLELAKCTTELNLLKKRLAMYESAT